MIGKLKKYDAFTYHEGQPIIGEAEMWPGGEIRVYLWLQPNDGLFYLKPKKARAS